MASASASASTHGDACVADAPTQDLLSRIESISTRNSWSTLPSFISKLNKKFPTQKVTARSFVSQLKSVPTPILAQHGVWMHSFGKKYMPLVLTNAAYRRAWRSALKNKTNVQSCSCGAKTYRLTRINSCLKTALDLLLPSSSARYINHNSHATMLFLVLTTDQLNAVWRDISVPLITMLDATRVRKAFMLQIVFVGNRRQQDIFTVGEGDLKNEILWGSKSYTQRTWSSNFRTCFKLLWVLEEDIVLSRALSRFVTMTLMPTHATR